MSTVSNWTADQKTAVVAWRDPYLVANPGATDQEMLDALNAQPAVGHWVQSTTQPRDTNYYQCSKLVYDYMAAAGVEATDDYDTVRSTIKTYIAAGADDNAKRDRAYDGAVATGLMMRDGFVASDPPTTETVEAIPSLVLGDITEIRAL